MDDEDAFAVQARADLLIDIKEDVLDDEEAIPGVVDDVGELVGMLAQAEGVQDGSCGGDAEVGFQVLVTVPEQRADAVAFADTGALECGGEASRALVEIGDRVAVGGASGER